MILECEYLLSNQIGNVFHENRSVVDCLFLESLDLINFGVVRAIDDSHT